MNKTIKVITSSLFFIFISLSFSACSQKTELLEPAKDDDKLKVMVSILPQLEFVERIGGDKVDASVMIPPGFSPATYDPAPSQLKTLQDASIYFRIGHIPFEKFQMEKLERINPEMTVVDTSVGIELLDIANHEHEEEHSLNEDSHIDAEEGDDPHIWLSPQLVKIQAKHIYDALVVARGEDQAYFLENYNLFIKDLEALDLKLQKTFEPIQGQTILAFHPFFGYLAEAYGFRQEVVEMEGKDPSPEHLKDIIARAKDDEVRVIFVQKQFSQKSAKAIADEIRGAVIEIDPLAQDYFNNLEEMSALIVNEIN